jgi:hypothetical protein
MLHAISRHGSKVNPNELSPSRTVICDDGFSGLF